MNPVCELFGIEHPILLGGMLFAGRARLAAAVSEAGGLGILGAGRMKPEHMVAEIAAVRALTEKPFGVNIPLRGPEPEALISAALRASVKVFATSGGSPKKFIDQIKSDGATIMQVVASVRQAVSAQAAGVDAIVAEGGESGGIVSRDLVSTLTLVPQVVDAVRVPVIAAGGIADGRGMAASFALGAQGIQMGTRFLACDECDIAADYKEALLMAGDTDTWVFRNASGVGRRTLKKELLECAAQMVAEKSTKGDSTIVAPEREDTTHHGRAAGQGAGLVHAFLPAKEIIASILYQAGQVARKVNEEIG